MVKSAKPNPTVASIKKRLRKSGLHSNPRPNRRVPVKSGGVPVSDGR